MTQHFREGTEVSWSWGAHHARGKVRQVFTRRVQRTIAGTRVVRRGSEDKPAYLVEQSDGSRALKSHSELNAVH